MQDTNIFQVIKRNSEISNQHDEKSSRIRNVASQVLVTTITNLVKFAMGSLIGFTSLLLAELSQENSEIKITKGELSWFASYFYMNPVGAILLGLLAHEIGSRVMLLIVSITYSISCIMFYFATNSTIILVAQALVGLMMPATTSCGTTYIAEIAQPHLRSPLITSGYLCMSFGMFFIMLMRQFFQWKMIAIIIAIFPAIGFLGILFIPDSPHWLARKGRYDETIAALAWVRGWMSSDDVTSEFLTLKEANTEVKSEGTISQKRSIRVLMKPYMEKSLWIPMCIVFYILIMHSLTGSESLKTFNVVIFRMNETPFDIYIASAIYDGVRIIGGMICMFSISTLGKRKLLFISLVGAGIAHIVIAVVLLLIKLEIGNSSGYLLWISPVMLIFSSLTLSMGVEKVTYMLNSELLPNRFRDIGMGMGRFVSTLVSSMFAQVFLYMVEAMTMPGVFLFYGINCIIAFVTFYFIVPETEGKTLIEIENHFAGKQSKPNNCND